jgi:hypothetical protein
MSLEWNPRYHCVVLRNGGALPKGMKFRILEARR